MNYGQIKQLADKAWQETWSDHLKNREDVEINKRSFYLGFMKRIKIINGYRMQEHKKEQEIISRFTNHIPDVETLEKMKDIRGHVRALARVIESLCPESREKATALTQLSFVMMSANSAIVQCCPVNEDDLQEWER